MKLLIQSVMIFFGTLMTAALVALGEPATELAFDRGHGAAGVPAHLPVAMLAAAEGAMATAAGR